MSIVRATADAYLGLEAPTDEEWRAWHRAMLAERDAELTRAGLDPAGYRDPSTDWSDTTFRQVFLFMYDTSFYDRGCSRYRTEELVEEWRARFGRVDSALLWHAYPRLGFDTRTQFDFYRDMPGGVARLREQVSDVLHASGVRVFVDYNPWATGGYDELGQIVAELDADGVMLDTLAGAPGPLAREVAARRRGVVLAPELRPRLEDLGDLRQAWAQWSDVGDAATPSILRHRWLVPRHRQLSIRRWDASRAHDIVYSFFNGSGLLLWDNVFGAWNPYPRADRRLIAETGAILDHYETLFARGEWLPLVPTGVRGLDANRWTRGGRAVVTLRNRSGARLAYRVPDDAPPGLRYFAFWGERRALRGGDRVGVDPHGVQALVLDDPTAAERALAHFGERSRRADVDLPGYDERLPRPRPIAPGARAASVPAARAKAAEVGPGAPNASPDADATSLASPDAEMIALPAGDGAMTIRHERRECGCYPFGADDSAMWGWFYKDVIEHTLDAPRRPYAIRSAAVTNAEFLAFVHAAGYRPEDGERFLKHVPRLADGSLPRALSAEAAPLPVTFVSLADARAFAAWCGQRLPTEAEWQWAAEGAGARSVYPWGAGARTFAPSLRPARDAATATPQGVMGLSGNAWELTESEHTDGHTRFVMLRGGVYLPPADSEWLVARGARPNAYHAKYVLLSDGVDRSESVSFRTVADLQPAGEGSRPIS